MYFHYVVILKCVMAVSGCLCPTWLAVQVAYTNLEH